MGVGIHIPEFKINISKRSDSYLYIQQKLWQPSLRYSGLKRSDLGGIMQCTDLSIADLYSQWHLSEKTYRTSSLLRLHQSGIDTHFCWVPVHEGVETRMQTSKRGIIKGNNSSNSTRKRRRKSSS